MVKNMNLGKRFISAIIAVSLIGCGIGGYHINRKRETNRVKGYLEDFLTEDNYVDLSKISTSYDIKDFKGEYLYEALKDSDIDYVRITNSYIYDGAHVTPFKQVNAVNYNNVLWVDGEGNDNYEMYEPIRNNVDGKLTYSVPESFVMEEIDVVAEPIRYEELLDREVDVIKNNYEDSYSLVLSRSE